MNGDLTDLIFEDEIKNKVIEQVDDLIERLPERKKEIVKLRFGLDDGKFKSGSECGAILGTSRQYVNATEADRDPSVFGNMEQMNLLN